MEGKTHAKYEIFANIYNTAHIPSPSGPAILSVRTGFLTSLRTQLMFDHPAYALRTLNVAVAYCLIVGIYVGSGYEKWYNM